jgi:glucose-1-phosphate thymidylyltransferase
VANRPIICHVLDALALAGVVETLVVAPRDAAQEISACLAEETPVGITVRHLLTDETDDEGDVLRAVAEQVGEAPCILHRAHGLLGEALPPYLELLGTENLDALLLTDDGGRDPRHLRLVTSPATPSTAEGTLTASGYAGVCLLGPGVLARLEDPVPLHDFAALAQGLARATGSAEVRVARRWRHFAGDALDLLDLNRTLLETLGSEHTPSPYDGNRFEGPVVIHPTACVSSSVIVGPALIGAGSLIVDSYIGPHTSIGERVRIEGAELERSIVLADASLLHVGGRLVASVVGRNARIFRDFSVPRALRLQVGDGDEVALC